MPGVWAGGDCVAGGEDLTVAAAQDGKLAAKIDPSSAFELRAMRPANKIGRLPLPSVGRGLPAAGRLGEG